RHRLLPALQIAQELEKRAGVVTLGKALAVHDAAFVENPIRVEEAVGRDEIDLGVVGPTSKERLEDAGKGALAHGHRSGDADHVGNFGRQGAEESGRHLVQILGGRDVQVQKTGEWQVHRSHFVEVDALVDTAQVVEVGLPKGHRRSGTEFSPLLAVERDVALAHDLNATGAEGRPTTSPSGGAAGRHGTVATGEDVDTGVGHENRVLELGGSLAVGGDGGPVVVPHLVLPGTKRDHRLDGEDHAGLHDHVVAWVVIVQDLDVGVELLADSVADESTDHTEVILGRVVFDCLADVRKGTIGFDGFDTAPHAFLGDADEATALGIDVANEECCVGIAVYALDVARHVEVDDVAIVENRGVRDAVADHLIEGCAHALRVAVVVERAWIRTTLDREIVDENIDVVGGDTGFHEFSGEPKDVGRHGAGMTHALDHFG
ncbi:MAG: hypothetical protein RL391_832, partial [Actinomycetota bacterium]